MLNLDLKFHEVNLQIQYFQTYLTPVEFLLRFSHYPRVPLPFSRNNFFVALEISSATKIALE